MVKRSLAFALFLGIVFPLLAAAEDSIVKFKGGIGVHPVSNVAGAANVDGTFPNVTRNIVRGVNPPGQIWVIADLRAEVGVNGGIRVKGKGLILGGGDNVGRATGQRVFATLICEAVVPFTQRNTNPTGVPLAPNGDFRIDDLLSPAPPLNCPSPMLLIRVAGSGNWFAAGIVNFGDDD